MTVIKSPISPGQPQPSGTANPRPSTPAHGPKTTQDGSLPEPGARNIADLQNKVWNWPQDGGSLQLP